MIYCVNIYCVLSIYIYSDLIEIFGSDRFMKGKLTAIVLTAVIIGVLFLSRTGAVSYTHLSVYKRLFINGEGLRLFPFIYIFKLRTQSKPMTSDACLRGAAVI